MTNPGVHLDVQVGRQLEPAAPLPDDPFLLLLVGDLSGRAGRDAPPSTPLADRRPVPVDRDEVEDVLARIAPRLDLALEGGARVELTFTELDDFHPDRLFARPFFTSLRETRSRLADPGSFRDTLDSILGATASSSPASAADAADDVVADVLGGGPSLLDRMASGDRPAADDPLRRYLRRIVAPHVLPGEDPKRDALLADVDESIAGAMRDVLHHPAFQALEALWRGVDFLVRRLDTGPRLKLMLLDATRSEVAADLASAHGVANGALARALRRADGTFWSAITCDVSVDADADGARIARGLAALGAHLGAPVLAGAAPGLVGMDVLRDLPDAGHVRAWDDDGWHALRRSPDATWLGLVLPRFLMRVPYGREGEPCERFPFEELDSPPRHDALLWGNGAWAATLLLGEAFAAKGWRMRPGTHGDVSGLPLHTYRTEAGAEMVPCAECLMSDRLAEALMDAGPMVLATVRHGDTARLVRFQSVATPPRALQGPWSRAT